MRKHEIEVWARAVIDRVQAKERNEDSRVELKRDWLTDYNKAARRLAAHANASRGEPILWLICVDEDKGVCGASPTDTADWLARVKSEFQETAPELGCDLTIDVN